MGTLALILGTAVLYFPVGTYEFVDYDDLDYVVQNPHVRDGWSLEELTWLSTHAHASNWHPLTWMSHMLDVQSFGLEAGGHHLVSVAFHALNGALLFLLLVSATGRGWASLFAALFFAVHPLRVESVAWISERKDVLSGTFWMLALFLYTRHARKPSALRMAAVVSVFLLAMAAKPMVVSLPLILLLWDIWPTGRWNPFGDPTLARNASTTRSILLEKVPLFALALGLSWVTFAVQSQSGATNRFEDLPLDIRCLNALAAFGAYLYQTFLPLDLAVFYPHAVVTSDSPRAALAFPASISVAVYAGLFMIAWRIRRRSPVLLVGLCWMVISLVPVIGIIQVGSQAHADRYTYLPTIGVGIALAFLAGDAVASRPNWRKPLAAASILVLALLGLSTRAQIRHWSDTEALFQHALDATSRNYTAHAELGRIYRQAGDEKRARNHLREALRIHPNFGEALSQLGQLHLARENYARARQLFERARLVRPRNPHALLDLGVLELSEGKLEPAEKAFLGVLELAPLDTSALFNLGCLEQSRRDFEAAEAYYRQALEEDPGHGDALNNLGDLLLMRNAFDEAVAVFDRLVRLESDDATVHFNLGKAHQAAGDGQRARDAFAEALKIDPHFEPAQRALEKRE
jgi:tetratricopeptide (TPR) repeat protein